ncbi:hypothetical protein [Bradyrhizobium sp. 186]|uniref:hypothetical protein n=1 Tax=Bradyrhizobium sp. 186 TaxID=2782654 RepID=UPI002001A735|nr:hypothetical protein [Bradyrhizobium sp. 186]
MPAVTNAVRDVVLDLLRWPLQPRCRSRLLDGEVCACRADIIHTLESKQIAGGINHRDRRERIPLLRALLGCSQNLLGSDLVEGHYVDGLSLDREAENRRHHSDADCEFVHSEPISIR